MILRLNILGTTRAGLIVEPRTIVHRHENVRIEALSIELAPTREVSVVLEGEEPPPGEPIEVQVRLL